MHRLVTGPQGLTRLLGWLEQRLGCRATLVDRDNAMAPPGTREPAVPAQARPELLRVAQGRCDSVAVHTPTQAVRLLSMGQSAPILVLVSEGCANSDSDLASDAARLLALRWHADRAEELERRMRQTENLVSESALYLVMTGHIEQARRVLSTIGSRLYEYMRIYLVEGSFGEREELAAHCKRVLKGRACVIRCPVYRRHLIIVAPTSTMGDDATDDPVGPLLRSVHPKVTIGAGSSVSVNALNFGYAEAFHALTLARETTDRYVRLGRGDDLSTHTPPAAFEWSRRVLSPLLRYVPERPQDPNGAELLVTLRSWLDFRGGASRQLNVHRNTLRSRIDRIAVLLGRDLDKVDQQAEVHLALRLARKAQFASGGEGRSVDLEELLVDESTTRWSEDFLGPLLSSPRAPVLCQTARTWLAEDAQVERAAAALGVSAPAVRKRLIRVEKMIGRSLLGAPSARFDLVLALRSWDAGQSRRDRVGGSIARAQGAKDVDGGGDGS